MSRRSPSSSRPTKGRHQPDFQIVNRAVNQQLRPATKAPRSWRTSERRSRNGANPPGAQGGSQNGAAPRADDAELVPASKSQLSYVRRLASSIGRAAALRVEVLVERSYGKPLGELSRAEAGRLIATLRAVKAGELDWETLSEEAAA